MTCLLIKKALYSHSKHLAPECHSSQEETVKEVWKGYQDVIVSKLFCNFFHSFAPGFEENFLLPVTLS